MPANTARELIALAKAKPGSLNYGMTGVGNSLHLTMEMFKRAAGIDIQAIPYRGDAPLNPALIAGEIDVAVVPLGRDRAPRSIGRDTRAGGEQRAALAGAAGRADGVRRCRPGLRGFGLARLVRAGEDAARDRRCDLSRDGEDHRRPRLANRLLAIGNEPVGSTPKRSPQNSATTSRNLLRSSRKRAFRCSKPERSKPGERHEKAGTFDGLRSRAAGHSPASAQTYPTKPIRIVVPFVAGGAVDLLARIMGQKLTEPLGQPMIIENRPGAGGNAAADLVAKSPPDGYTILQNTNGLAISPALYKKLPFDPVKDLTPVTQLVASQLLLVATPSLPANTTAN